MDTGVLLKWFIRAIPFKAIWVFSKARGKVALQPHMRTEFLHLLSGCSQSRVHIDRTVVSDELSRAFVEVFVLFLSRELCIYFNFIAARGLCHFVRLIDALLSCCLHVGLCPSDNRESFHPSAFEEFAMRLITAEFHFRGVATGLSNQGL